MSENDNKLDKETPPTPPSEPETPPSQESVEKETDTNLMITKALQYYCFVVVGYDGIFEGDRRLVQRGPYRRQQS